VALAEETSGLCYTFETSFHGFQKAGCQDPVAFTYEGYKHLGKDILLSFEKMVKASLVSEMPALKGKSLLSAEKEKELDLFIS
jgi:hypothetical protein